MAKPLRTLIALIAVHLGATLAFAGLTVGFAGPILAYRQAREPGQGHIHLVAELLTRPLPAVLIAVLYVVVLPAVARGSSRAFHRLRIFSVVGMISAGWVPASGPYPAWLSLVEILPAVTAVAVFAAANSRAVRAPFASPWCGPIRCRGDRSPLAL